MNDWKEDTFVDNMNHLLFDFLDKHADVYEGKMRSIRNCMIYIR